MLADFNAALPLLREAGYVLDGASVKIGVMPQIVANFAGGAVLSEERVNAMLAEHSGRKLTTLLVKACCSPGGFTYNRVRRTVRHSVRTASIPSSAPRAIPCDRPHD